MDIYDDLDNYNEGENIAALQSENQELKNKLDQYESAMQKLKKDHDKLAAEHKTLLLNFSALLKTARAEIERKTQTIMQINTEKDQMILRLVSNGNSRGIHQFRKSSSSTRSVRSCDSRDTVGTVKDAPIVTARPIENPKYAERKEIEDPSNNSKKFEQTIPKREHEPSNPRNSPELKGKENQNLRSQPLRIASRRKSMPASRSEEVPKLSKTNIEAERDYVTEKPKSSVFSRVEERLRERARASRSSNEPRERVREQDTLHEIRERERESNRIGEHRSRQRSRDNETFKDRAYKRTHSRNRIRSPSDIYYRNKSHDRRFDSKDREEYGRHRSQEMRHNINNQDSRYFRDERHSHERRQSLEKRDANKNTNVDKSHGSQQRRSHEKRPAEEKRISQEKRIEPNIEKDRIPETIKQATNEERELYAKRRKVESVTDNFSRWGRSYDSPTLPVFSDVHGLPTSCQSPDENFVTKPVTSHDIREIKLTAQSKLEDPRYQSCRYIKVADSNSKPVLASVAGRNVDLQILRWNQESNEPDVPEKLKEKPKELIEPPDKIKHSELSDKLVNDIYNDIDVNEHDISMESGELIDKDISETLIFSSALKESERKQNNDLNPAPKELLTYDANFLKTNKNSGVSIQKYKIPKKKAIEHDSVPEEKPLDLLNKHHKSEESTKVEQGPNKTELGKQDNKYSNNSSNLREMVESDLALSDDENSHARISNMSKQPEKDDLVTKTDKDDLVKKPKKSKEHKHKSKHTKTKEKERDIQTKIESDQNDKSKEINKSKEIKERFSDLFGDSSLITPEDLNIPSEPVFTANNIMEMSENANLGGENEEWSITNEYIDKAKESKTVEVSEEISETQNVKINKVAEKSPIQSSNTNSDTNRDKQTSILETNIENNEQRNKTNLIPETITVGDNHCDVIKTVIISSGVQPLSGNEMANVDRGAPLAQPNPVIHTDSRENPEAIATSTPLQITDRKNIVTENRTVTEAVTNTIFDESQSKSLNMTNSFSGSETPDVRIILKRKKRVLKK